MKEPVLIAPRSSCKEMVPSPDLDRYLESGSYVKASLPKKRSAGAKRQEAYMRRRLETGYRILHTLLPDHVFAELRARLREGESFAELVERLLAESIADSSEKGQ